MDVTFAHAAGARHPEDWIATSPEAVVLLDGLSTPEGFHTGCRHGTPWYVRRLGTRLLQLLATHPGRTVREALAGTIQAVAQSHADTCDLSHPGMPCGTAALLRAGPPDVQCLVLSDALIVLGTLQHAGPAELIRRIRHAEASDPLGECWPRCKTGAAALCVF